jgi:hypothetical protein
MRKFIVLLLVVAGLGTGFVLLARVAIGASGSSGPVSSIALPLGSPTGRSTTAPTSQGATTTGPLRSSTTVTVQPRVVVTSPGPAFSPAANPPPVTSPRPTQPVTTTTWPPVTVPDLIGLGIQQFEAAVLGAHLAELPYECSQGGHTGPPHVIQQQPAAGAVVPFGSWVQVVFEGPPCPPPPQPPPQGTKT